MAVICINEDGTEHDFNNEFTKMLGTSLSDMCKYHQVSIAELSVHCGVPVRTLRDWHKTKPLLIKRIFESLSVLSIVEFHEKFKDLK